MGDDNITDNVATGVSTYSKILEMAGNDPNVKKAGSELAKSAVIIAETVNTSLLPLAAVNFGFKKAKEYFATKFEKDISEKGKDIPPERLIEPKHSLAGPILQSLAFSHEEESLKDMYLNLLKSSMDSKTENDAHPAFIEIIKQLTSEEANILSSLLCEDAPYPIIDIRRNVVGKNEWTNLLRHILDFTDKNLIPIENPRMSAMVENWIRLGLVEVGYNAHIVGDNVYDWADDRPEVIYCKSQYETDDKHEIGIKKGFLKRTSLGAQFSNVAGLKEISNEISINFTR